MAVQMRHNGDDDGDKVAIANSAANTLSLRLFVGAFYTHLLLA